MLQTKQEKRLLYKEIFIPLTAFLFLILWVSSGSIFKILPYLFNVITSPMQLFGLFLSLLLPGIFVIIAVGIGYAQLKNSKRASSVFKIIPYTLGCFSFIMFMLLLFWDTSDMGGLGYGIIFIFGNILFFLYTMIYSIILYKRKVRFMANNHSAKN